MSFEPIYAPDAHTLILGTYPSPKSREQGFYYGHPQNRFWPLLALLLGEQTPAHADIDAKKRLITAHALALWDTCDTCTVQGASDATIADVVPNDIETLCVRLPIRRVLCNGATAYKLYQKFHRQGPPAVCLPSTSPANAAFSLQRLAQVWGEYIAASR